jgi:hypothetical protein
MRCGIGGELPVDKQGSLVRTDYRNANAHM